MKFSIKLLLVLILFGINEFPVAGDLIRINSFSASKPPKKLSETGIFKNLEKLIPSAGILPYEVNAPLWSDGALKWRWIILPEQVRRQMEQTFPGQTPPSTPNPSEKIQFAADEPWQFPIGTLFIKHFELPRSSTETTRVETRVLVHTEDDDWKGYTYVWQDDQKEANLIKSSEHKEYSVFDASAPQGIRKQLWTFPSRQDCLRCHNPWSGYVLGVRTEQINKTITIPEGSINQLDFWRKKEFFSKTIDDSSHYESYAHPEDLSQPLEKRARSYLASNCAQCHQPGSPVRTDIDLRFKTPLVETQLILQEPNAGNMELPNPYLIKPGSKEESILWLRMINTSSYRMPTLGTILPDQIGIDVIGQWIDQMKNPVCRFK